MCVHLHSTATIVAPFVGAWIETCMVILEEEIAEKSLPSWERGLKPVYLRRFVIDRVAVAPFVGAWIVTI